jgi:hypothetical protein
VRSFLNAFIFDCHLENDTEYFMSDSNLITAYSWATGLFQQVLPSSLEDIEKRAKLVYEINTPLVKAKNGHDKMLIWFRRP